MCPKCISVAQKFCLTTKQQLFTSGGGAAQLLGDAKNRVWFRVTGVALFPTAADPPALRLFVKKDTQNIAIGIITYITPTVEIRFDQHGELVHREIFAITDGPADVTLSVVVGELNTEVTG